MGLRPIASILTGPPRQLILAFQRRLGIDVFIEGGTYLGSTAAWASAHFPSVITIEAAEPLYQKAKNLNSRLFNVDFRHGETTNELPHILRALERPAVFWLDSHWSGGETFGEFNKCPLIEELSLILSNKLDHLVLIDDARLFLNPDSEKWPNIAAITQSVEAGDIGRSIVIIEDVIVICSDAHRDLIRSSSGTSALQLECPDLPSRLKFLLKLSRRAMAVLLGKLR